ncbi:MAG: VOC family protein [Anaerolineae bacterium]|nr:VOC family protein [Anaerolineae bacterium]
MDYTIRALDHVSIVVNDVDAARRFYCDILGMTEVARPANFTFPGAWFRQGGAELHLIRRDVATQDVGDPLNTPLPNGDVTFARHFAFQIDNMDELVKQLQAHGVSIAYGPRPRGDGPTQVYIYDPDGHMIEFTEKP